MSAREVYGSASGIAEENRSGAPLSIEIESGVIDDDALRLVVVVDYGVRATTDHPHIGVAGACRWWRSLDGLMPSFVRAMFNLVGAAPAEVIVLLKA